VVDIVVKRNPGSRSLLLLKRPLSVVRDDLANGSCATSGTNTGTDCVSDSGLRSLSVLVDGAGSGSRSGDRDGSVGLSDGRSSDRLSLDRLGSSVVGSDRLPGRSSGSEFVSVNVVAGLFVIDQSVGSTRVELSGVRERLAVVVVSDRSSSGLVSVDTVVVVGSSAGRSLLLADGGVLGLLLVGGDDGDLGTSVRSGDPVAHTAISNCHLAIPKYSRGPGLVGLGVALGVILRVSSDGLAKDSVTAKSSGCLLFIRALEVGVVVTVG
jgi:hypothetical protein